MRHTLIVLALFLSSCGGDDEDPHATVSCEGWVDNQGNPITGTCEAGCRKPPGVSGDVCDTVVSLNCPSHSFSGVEGCCLVDGATIRFYECQ